MHKKTAGTCRRPTHADAASCVSPRKRFLTVRRCMPSASASTTNAEKTKDASPAHETVRADHVERGVSCARRTNSQIGAYLAPGTSLAETPAKRQAATLLRRLRNNTR